MSATKEFLYELQRYVWLIEFGGLTFEERGRAIELMHEWLFNEFGESYGPEFNEWFDAAYELIEEGGGSEWASGLEAKTLLDMVHVHEWESAFNNDEHEIGRYCLADGCDVFETPNME